jgi:hypothetical protein
MPTKKEFKPRKPDYKLKYFNPVNGDTDVVGVAWLDHEKGHLSIHLNPLVVIEEKSKFILTLFPNVKNKS